MDNQLNSGSLSTLKEGQTILINGRKVKGDKIKLNMSSYMAPGELLQKIVDEFNDNKASVRILNYLEKQHGED